MFFKRKVVKGRYIDHPLGRDQTIKKGLSSEELSLFLKKIRDGTLSSEEREYLIKSFISLVLCIAGRYKVLKPDLEDDLVSEGLRGVIYGIEKAKEKLKDDNIAAWITSNIHRFMTNLIMKDTLIPISPSVISRNKDVVAMISHDLKKTEEISTTNLYKIGELKEEIYHCARDAIDQFILDMRLQGYEDYEIASFLEMGKSTIAKRRIDIKTRYEERNKL